MKKINLRGVSETLSEKELKNVVGGLQAAESCQFDCVIAGQGGVTDSVVGLTRREAQHFAEFFSNYPDICVSTEWCCQ
jgi:natural product precursor